MKNKIKCIYETPDGYLITLALTKEEIIAILRARREFYLNQWCDNPNSGPFESTFQLTGITFTMDYKDIIELTFKSKEE